jgi:hypothetical protein
MGRGTGDEAPAGGEQRAGGAGLGLDQPPEQGVRLGIAGERADLVLPQVEEAPRQRGGLGRVALSCHARSIAQGAHPDPCRAAAPYRGARRGLRVAAFPATVPPETTVAARFRGRGVP